MEEIKHAAVRSECGWIFIGKCHGDCMLKMDNIGIKPSPKAKDQGFVTSKGRYVERPEAAEIAYRACQIDCSPEHYPLFSEDLWCPDYNGKHDYCEIEGYIKSRQLGGKGRK